MAEQNAVATQQGTQLSVAAQVKSMISQDAVKKKFTEVLPAFHTFVNRYRLRCVRASWMAWVHTAFCTHIPSASNLLKNVVAFTERLNR